MVVRELVTRLGFSPDTAGLRKADTAVMRFAGKMQNVGRKMSFMITAPLVGMGIGVFKASMDFNKAMANVATLIPGNIERVKSLKSTVQNLAIQFGKSTDDIAGGLYQVISAFGDTADTEEILKINTEAAAAGMATVTDAINLTSAVTKAYGDTSAEAVQHSADLAFQTVKLGQTTFPELASEIQNVTPLASTLGLKVEELFGLFATLTGVTGDTNKVSTQLASIMRAFIRPTANMKLAIKKLGYESSKTMLSELGLLGALKGVISTTDGSEESIGKLVMRAEGLTAIFPLLTNLAETYTWKTKEMGNVTGATAEAHKEMAEGINKTGYEYEQAKQRIIVASQKLGDALGEKGAFASISKRIEDLTDAIREASPETIDFFTNLGIALAGLGVGSLILSKIVLVVSTLAPYITQIAAAIIPIMDFIQWMKGEGPSMFQDILGEFPGPFGKGGGKPGEPPSIFSKEGFEAAKPYINDFIKGLNTLATLGLNWVGLPEPVPYIKPSSTTQPVVVNAENHVSVTLPEGASEDKVIQATQKSVSDSLDTLARDIQRNFPKTE